MNSVEDRISKIKADRVELLKKVGENIKDNKNNLSENITDVIEVLNFDDKCVKKYEALVNAQKLVEDLTLEISDAKSVEEVKEIRKKLNYYITKIKNEAKKREIDVEKLSDYQNKATSLRKDIAKYIRYLKRDEKYNEIDNLYSNYSNLSLEDKKKLSKMITNEVNYNRRNLSSKNDIVKDVIDTSLSNDVDVDVKSNDLEEDTPDIIYDVVDDDLLLDDNNDYEEKLSFLSRRSKELKNQYSLSNLSVYGRSRGRNIVKFFSNIPKYIDNKRKIKLMEKDYCMYYRGADLVSYIEYTRKRNSITNGLKSIFSKTYLYSDEGQYLNKHRKCSKWLFDFCDKNNIIVNYPKTLKKLDY